jgi:hypothetical protein
VIEDVETQIFAVRSPIAQLLQGRYLTDFLDKRLPLGLRVEKQRRMHYCSGLLPDFREIETSGFLECLGDRSPSRVRLTEIDPSVLLDNCRAPSWRHKVPRRCSSKRCLVSFGVQDLRDLRVSCMSLDRLERHRRFYNFETHNRGFEFSSNLQERFGFFDSQVDHALDLCICISLEWRRFRSGTTTIQVW